MKKIIVRIMMVTLILVTSYIYGQSGSIEAGENIAVVSTQYGKVRGYIDDGIYAFKGIPYAKADRFMPPQPPNSWDEVRQCTIYGPQAMQGKSQDWRGQSDSNFGFQASKEAMDEKESFVINVWSKGINDGKKRPVFVWLHGGGYSGGSGNQFPYFDGRSLAAKGDIVVVTVNHRLNVLGYLDLRGLGGKYAESVNLGMQDLVVALEWVKENIANFGGDSSRVTIDGQSGGGGKVSTLLGMPSAAGLFQGAIIQSGSYLKVAEGDLTKAYGLAFVKALGINNEEADKLDNFTYEELVAAEREASVIMRADGYTNITRIINPTVDGKYIKQHPFDPGPPDFAKDVAMIIGSNLNERGSHNRMLITPQTMDQVKATLSQRYGADNAEKYIAAYKKAYPNDTKPQHILTTFVRSTAVEQASLKVAQGGAPVYMYVFEWQSPVNDGSLGAAHGMELPFMFNNIAMARTQTGGGKDAYELADKMSSAWINFIKTGNPNTKNLPEWTAYTPSKGATMIFDNKCEVRYHFDQGLIDLENSLGNN